MKLCKMQGLLVKYNVFNSSQIAAFERQRRAINKDMSQFKLLPKEEFALYSYLILLGGQPRGNIFELFLKYERLTFPAEQFEGESLAQIENGDKPPIYYGYTCQSKNTPTPSWKVTFSEGESVWDVGCGDGQDVIYWAKNYPWAPFVGCDANARNIRAAILYLQQMDHQPNNLSLALGDFYEKDVLSGSIDALIMKGTLAGMRRCIRERLIKTLTDKVNPNGGRILADFIFRGEKDKMIFANEMKLKGVETLITPLLSDNLKVEDEEIPYSIALSKLRKE